MTDDTTHPSYWLNWRVLLCGLWLIVSIALASFLIWKKEGPGDYKDGTVDEEPAGLLYEDDVWRPCLKGVHPAWLLAFRVVAFFVLLILLILYAIVDGGSIFYYYTQWTFTLITIYFGLACVLSMYGCYQYHCEVSGDRVNNGEIDAEQGTHGVSVPAEYTNTLGNSKSFAPNEESYARKTAGFWGYALQIIFQINAGAVVLTDCVFWFIIVPFLAIKGFELNFLIINMHSINAVFLVGDITLNRLRFPWFRIAYFFLWTAVYVIFQWIVHASISIRWPYPFLDLSFSLSPLWYVSVALLHLPCFGVFALVMKLKHALFSRWFGHSFQCSR